MLISMQAIPNRQKWEQDNRTVCLQDLTLPSPIFLCPPKTAAHGGDNSPSLSKRTRENKNFSLPAAGCYLTCRSTHLCRSEYCRVERNCKAIILSLPLSLYCVYRFPTLFRHVARRSISCIQSLPRDRACRSNPATDRNDNQPTSKWFSLAPRFAPWVAEEQEPLLYLLTQF
jgi:hypothetical protein